MTAIPGMTLLLDQSAWDLVITAAGDIAVASAPYALAQDVASAARTFLGEVYFDTTIGVPYLQQLLNNRPTQQQLKSALTAAALTVPGVVKAQVVLNSFIDTITQAMAGQPIIDSAGDAVIDSSGGTVLDSPPSVSLQNIGLRNVVGQILFIDVNNDNGTVSL